MTGSASRRRMAARNSDEFSFVRIARSFFVLLGCGLTLTGAARAVDFIAGTGLAGADGHGVISFRVDPSVEEMITAGSMRQKMTLSSGARLESVKVEAGVVYLTFGNARPDGWVDVRLPEDVYADTVDEKPSMIGSGAVIHNQAVLGRDPAAGGR
jgi:hypothetical protein